MCNTHTTCVLFLHSQGILHGFSALLAWKLSRHLGTSTDWPQQTLHRSLKKHYGTIWIPQLHCFEWFPRRQRRNGVFSFLDHREFWTFWESLWTSIKRDLFNVWIRQRRGSQINWANVEMDLLPTPLQCNHISPSTSVDNYWIRHSKRWLTNRNQANKDNLPSFLGIQRDSDLQQRSFMCSTAYRKY